MTMDSMGRQRKIEQKVVDKSVDYLLAVKRNQVKLEKEINDFYRHPCCKILLRETVIGSRKRACANGNTLCSIDSGLVIFLGWF